MAKKTKKKTSKATAKKTAKKKKAPAKIAKKKAAKKAGKTAGVKPKSPPIKKNAYVVEEFGDGFKIFKIESEDSNSEVEVYTVDPNGICDCKASEFGTDCKHVAMTTGSLTFGAMPRDIAESILDTYLEQVLRPKFPRARFVNLLGYKKDAEVGNAAALACGVLSDRAVEKLTLWTVAEKLLIRVHCFKDLARYRRALTRIRQKAFGVEAPVDVSADGQNTDVPQDN